MKFSVIIPSYDRVGFLPRAIDSVLAQANDSLEIIVIDDGSTDGTYEFLNENYPDIILIQQENSGVSAARNKGISQASGEWIALLDSDDEWLEGKLHEQLSELENSGLKVCHADEIWIRNGVRVNQMNKHKKRGGAIFKYCLPLCAMSPSSIVIHRSVFESVGLFDESLPACEDYDLWLRITAHYEVAFIDKPLINKYGGHEDQLSRQYWGMDRFRVTALDKLLSKPENIAKLGEENYGAAIDMLLKKLKILLKGAIKHQNHMLAVGWVGALRTNQDCAWLNIGTSGHASRELGELVLIHGVGDEVQQRSHYPSLVAKWSGQTDAVLSVSTPSDDYPEGAAVDMEAYAFFNSALRFSDSELVQSLKVVSDNRLSGIEELNAAKLTRYMSSNCLEVIAFAKSLISLIRPKYSIAYDTQSLFELRGTHSQRLQVTQLLQKLQVMNCVNSIDDELTQCKDLSGVLTCLKKALTAAMPSLPIDKADGDL